MSGCAAKPGKRGTETMSEPLVECLLQAVGDSAVLNTFDKQFRSGTGPQWSDRPCDGTPRYSLHALFPVPEDIQRRGYQRAGKLWCQDYWKTPDDLTDMQVKRVKGERRYRFFTPVRAPTDVFWKVSSDFPTLKMRLVLLGTDRGDLQSRFYCEGTFQGSYSPNGAAGFVAIREEMGFAA